MPMFELFLGCYPRHLVIASSVWGGGAGLKKVDQLVEIGGIEELQDLLSHSGSITRKIT